MLVDFGHTLFSRSSYSEDISTRITEITTLCHLLASTCRRYLKPAQRCQITTRPTLSPGCACRRICRHMYKNVFVYRHSKKFSTLLQVSAGADEYVTGETFEPDFHYPTSLIGHASVWSRIAPSNRLNGHKQICAEGEVTYMQMTEKDFFINFHVLMRIKWIKSATTVLPRITQKWRAPGRTTSQNRVDKATQAPSTFCIKMV